MRPFLLAAALPLLAACDGLFDAELQIPEIRVKLAAQAFPASGTPDQAFWCDPLVQPLDPCVGVTLDYDLGTEVPVLDEKGVTYDLRLTDVALTLSAEQATPGTDLSAVKSATLAVFDPAVPDAETVVATYVRPPGTGTVSSLAVSGNSNLDLGPYLHGGTLRVRVELVIDRARPTPAFTADVEAGFALEVDVDYGAYL